MWKEGSPRALLVELQLGAATTENSVKNRTTQLPSNSVSGGLCEGSRCYPRGNRKPWKISHTHNSNQVFTAKHSFRMQNLEHELSGYKEWGGRQVISQVSAKGMVSWRAARATANVA